MKYKVIENNNKSASALYRILENRGITDPYHYLHTTDDDIINPKILQNIDLAAKTLIKHVSQEHDIFVNIDSDCDGYTSAAFMINWLYKTFPGYTIYHVKWGMHNNKEHGLLMDQILELKPQLVICPDAGSNEYELHKTLKNKNIDVIIIDHHNADKISEDAIVVNNQLDPNYPTKSLSGVGMVYKFCSYLDQFTNNTFAEDMLDLAALGIIADVMELKDYETRRIIDKGLANIENPFIKAMCAKNEYSMGDIITPTGVAWYIAPTVNAVARVGTLTEKQLMFESMLHHRAYQLVLSTKRGHTIGETETIIEQAIRTCMNVKKRQDKSRDQMFEHICDKIENEHLDKEKILLVKLNQEESNTAITGLIANKLMSKYGHPTMVLNQTFDDETGELIWAGSGRNAESDDMPSLQQFAKNSGFFTLAQGHDNALGLAIPDSLIDQFMEYANNKLHDADFTPQYVADVEFLSNKINITDILEIADAVKVWGEGVNEPFVVIKNVNVTKDNINLFGSTLKINLPENLSIVKFKSSQEEFDKLCPVSDGCTTIDVIGRCVRNTKWDNGPEIIMIDYDIKRKLDYYF